MNKETDVLELVGPIDLCLSRLGYDMKPRIGDDFRGVFADGFLDVNVEKTGVGGIDINEVAGGIRDDDTDLHVVEKGFEKTVLTCKPF